jgi:cytochrome P450
MKVSQVDYASLPMSAGRTEGWAALRACGPVVLMDGWYHLTQREDVLFALRSPEVFSSRKAFDMLGSPLPLVPIAFDPPEHTRYRKILQPFFSPATIGQILPQLRDQALGLIDHLLPGGSCDVVTDLAIPYPSQVFLTMFGLPLADLERFIGWKDAVIALADHPNIEDADLTPALELFGYLTDLIACLRAEPGSDVLSQLLTGADPLTDAEAIGLSYLFVLAGLDTVTSAIGFAMLELARNRRLRAELRANPEAVRVFVEEVVRLEPPAPLLPRVTTQEVRIGDITLAPDTPVKLCLGAINRDGSDPTSTNHVVMDGKIHKHWGFGGGPHRCLGSHLARAELSLVITEWLQRIPEFEVEPEFIPRIAFPAQTYTLTSLPLRWPTP